jgi:predicted GNAT superfamily acetyltransferase
MKWQSSFNSKSVKMIRYTTSSMKADLYGILDLQKANLASALTVEEISSQGFVTVKHSYDDLKKLNDIEQHIIARDGKKIIAYLLAMTEKSKFDIPVLIPMFEMFGKTYYKGKPISGYNYIVVGQVCVARQYRGQGIPDLCYEAYKVKFELKYDFAITEIDSTNLRSLNAHKRIGFKEMARYISNENIEWCIVLWDWKNEDK